MVKNNNFSPSEKEFLTSLKKALYLIIVAIFFLGSIPVFLLFLQFPHNENIVKNAEILNENPSPSEIAILTNSKSFDPLEKTDTALLAEGKGMEIVKANCTPCHSARLIVQNRATREGWLSMIRWMQQTQNLWDLGANEEIILDYLSTHYPPEEKSRRENLKDIEWYVLED
ncbi:hypothetical protein BH23BAC1_BH23BAC1_38390 [soil metagenome]